MRRLMREIASGKGLNRVMPLDGSVTEGSLLNTGKPEFSTGHHTPSLKRKDRHTTEVALSEQGLYPFEPGASASAFALSR